METLHDSIIEHPFFDGMKPEYLAMLGGGAKEETFEKDAVLFREGEPANHFYLIQSGKIALESHKPGNGTAFVQELGAGDVLGWSWLFPPFSWHFQARAMEPTSVIVLSGAHLLIAAERNHDFGYELMKRVSQLVIKRLQATRNRLLPLQEKATAEG